MAKRGVAILEDDALPARVADALRATERRLQAVLDNATVAIFLMDDHQHCVYMNRAAEVLTGYSLAETQGRPLHDVVHHTRPDGTPYPLEECPIDQAFPEHNRMQGEEVFVHRDGSFYPVAYTASPIRDEAARVIGTIIEVRDISAEKEAARRQSLLIEELNHRVKNTLATVQSIAAQSFRALPGSGDAARTFEGRLRALVEAHGLLTDENWLGAPLAEVARRVTGPFGDAERISIRGPDVQVPPKLALVLSMALHELATNAAKYGALSVEGGSVVFEWSAEQVDGGLRLLLTWTERGGPPVTPPARTGFGMRLIEKALPREFDANVSLTFPPEGITCRIEARMPHDGLGLWDGLARHR